MELINGIQILSQTLIYEIQSLWLLIGIMALAIGMTTFIISCDIRTGIGAAIGACITVVAIFILGSGNKSNSQGWFNQPKTIQYTIEIIDDNAWKEIGPRFEVVEKVYDNKEIYIIKENLTSTKN